MSIDFQHAQYQKRAPQWIKIDNVCDGENVEQYLVKLNPLDTSADNRKRNEQYAERAVFYAIAGQTVAGMVGSIFRKWPTIQAPPELQYVETNTDGAGVSIYQQSQSVCSDVLRKGRAGLLVSFPVTEGQVSRADILSGRVTATTHHIRPEQIINWRAVRDGARVRLALVVIAEQAETIADDGYTVETEVVLRELYLDADGVYQERKWRKIKDKWQAVEFATPTDASGNTWDEIPFTFVGSMNNDSDCDQPPSLGIVNLNVGHYRNSADYEDSVYFAGQPQPWMSGVTVDHLTEMKNAGMYIGGRHLIPVPPGETFGFAQAAGNPMVRQAMLDKLDMMIALGARIMQPGSATKTATQAAGEIESQTSILSLVASNVSEAYTQALVWCARFVGASQDGIEYTLNQEFISTITDPQELQQIVSGFIQGAVPMADYVLYMKRRGLFDDAKPVEEYADDLSRPALE